MTNGSEKNLIYLHQPIVTDLTYTNEFTKGRSGGGIEHFIKTYLLHQGQRKNYHNLKRNRRNSK